MFHSIISPEDVFGTANQNKPLNYITDYYDDIYFQYLAQNPELIHQYTENKINKKRG